MLRAAALIASFVLATPAFADDGDPDCYDAIVSAEIVDQTPTPYPELAGAVVLSWPWIDRLEIERVVEGPRLPRHVDVLVIQHSGFTLHEARRCWLRRNSQGGFNLLRLDQPETLPRCAPGTPPARPYLVLKEGQSLRDVIRESQRSMSETD